MKTIILIILLILGYTPTVMAQCGGGELYFQLINIDLKYLGVDN